MPRLLRCPQGHEWDPSEGGGAQCPVCGSTEWPPTTATPPTATFMPGGPPEPSVPPPLEAYEVREQIGAGGMGIVYKARHRQRDRLVALKIVRKDRLSNPDAVARFRREARAAGRLSHPNIVLLFESDSEGDTHYL